jgi:hypothetical protein
VKAAFFGRQRWLQAVVILTIFSAGLALRMINLTNPPLDLHTWRQLRAACIARGMYYSMLPDADPTLVDQAQYLGATFQYQEPRFFERIVSATYLLLGSEQLWVARLYAILFWMIGGVGLYLLARWMTSIDGAILSLAYFLMLPYAVTHSRLFIPDVLMIPFILLGLMAVYRWSQLRTWKWAILGGLLAGFAILVKVFAVFFTFLPAVLLILAARGLKKAARDPQIWVMFGIMAILPTIHYLILSSGAAGYFETWALPFARLLTDPHFYITWFHKLGVFNLTLVVLGLMGTALLPKPGRAMTIGLWLGYLMYGMLLAGPIRSHSYYSLPLTLTVAISLAPIGDLVLTRAARQNHFWQFIFLIAVLVGLGDAAIMARKPLTETDYRAEPAFWEALGKSLPTDGSYIGLGEDYNTRLQYYGWRFMDQYPYAFDYEMGRLSGHDFDVSSENWDFFLGKTEVYDYFLVTTLEEFEAQPYLKNILYNYYPLVQEGERYVLFDLRHPIQTIPHD